jgi:hypothetical protein
LTLINIGDQNFNIFLYIKHNDIFWLGGNKLLIPGTYHNPEQDDNQITIFRITLFLSEELKIIK